MRKVRILKEAAVGDRESGLITNTVVSYLAGMIKKQNEEIMGNVNQGMTNLPSFITPSTFFDLYFNFTV